SGGGFGGRRPGRCVPVPPDVRARPPSPLMSGVYSPRHLSLWSVPRPIGRAAARRLSSTAGRREEAAMALVICDMSMSLDGYVTGPNDSRQNPFGDGAAVLHDWLWDAATDEDRAILQEMVDQAGAVVLGRRSFDKNEGDGGWGDGGPIGRTPAFVVTHRRP